MPKFLLLLVFLALQFSQPAYGAQGLEVIQVTPQGMVNNLTQVTVRFSQDMRALGAMEQDDASSPVRLVPSVAGAGLPEGNWRWLDPSTLAYLFKTPLSGSVAFTVIVPKGARALNGASLEKEERFKINTPLIAIGRYHTSLGPNAEIILEANQPLDMDSLAGKSTLTVNNQPVKYSLNKIDYNQQPSRYSFKLQGELPPNAKLRLTVDKGVKPLNGFIVSPKAFVFNENGYSSLKLDQWQIGYYSDRNNQPGEAGSPLLLVFNNPVNYNDLLEHVSISPDVALGESPMQHGSSSGQGLAYKWRPRTDYKVTIKPGLKDIYGTTLAKPVSFTVKIGDYHPLIKINTGTMVAEASLGAIYPVMARNITPIEIYAKLLEWTPKNIGGLFRGGTDFSGLLKLPARLLKFEPNTVNNYQLELNGLLGQDALGKLVSLAVRYRPPGAGSKESDKTTQYSQLQVTNLGISFKMAQKQGLAWVNTLDTAQPVAEAKLAIYDYNGQELWNGRTDENGLCALPGMNELHSQWPPVLMASFGQDKAFVPLAWNRDFGYHFDQDLRWPARTQMHVISQLPIYQPGQEVNLLAYVRQSTPQGWQAISAGKVRVLLRDSRGGNIIDQEAELNDYGSVALNATLSEEAPLGSYYLYISGIGEQNASANGQAFQVAAFRTPDFKVDLQAPSSQPLPASQGTLNSRITAAYFFGAPVANAQGEVVVQQNEQYFAPERLKGYRVGINSNYRGARAGANNQELGRLPLNLDSQGQARLILPEPKVSPGETVSVSLEALVNDPSGLSTQGAASFNVYASSYFVGLKSPYLGKVNEPIKIDLKASTHDSQPLSNVPVNLRVRRLYVENEPIVLHKQVDITSANGVSADFTLKDSGSYEISVCISDQQGRENITTSNLVVTGPNMIWPTPYNDNRTLELIADQDSYRPGDTAQVIIKNPFAGAPARALITLERAGIVKYWLREVNEAAPVIEVPVDKSHAPYTYVTVQLIKGRTAPPPHEGGDLGKPAVALGTLLLNVEKTSDELSASLRVEREQYRPGQQVNLRVQASRQCQLTLLAVDKRVVRVAGDQTSYQPRFAPVQWRGVMAADIRTRLLDLSALAPEIGMDDIHPAARPMPSAMRADMAMAPMESEMMMRQQAAGATEEVRQNFSPAAYWLASVQTDRNGYYQASFKLPDSLTAYEIVAIVADKSELFALAQQEITVSQPLQVTSSLPGFITQGDEMVAQFLAHNLSGRSGGISVELQADGVQVTGPARQQVQAEAGQSVTFSYQIKASQAGEAKLLLRASMGNEKDAVSFTLPILPALPLTTVAAAGMLDTGQEYTLPVEMPQDVDTRSRLQVSLAPSPAAGLSLTAQTVMDYPWDCLEQRTSKAAIRITRLLHGELVGLASEPDDREKAQAVFDTIGKFQNSDGGFSLWSGMRGESSFYLTSYVMMVASQGKQADVTLDEKVRQRAISYLANQVNRQLTEDTNKYIALDTQALTAYVLAINGYKQTGSFLANLNKQAGKMNPMGLAAMMLGYHAADLPQPAGLMATLEKHVAITSTEMHFNTPDAGRYWYSMGSPLRDNALVLMALAQVRPDYPRLEALALWVCRGLGEKVYMSTQEAMYGIWGMGSYLKSLGGEQNVAIKAVWNQTRQTTASFSRLVDDAQDWRLNYDDFKPGANALSLQALSGKPYWTARLSYASMSNQQEINAGFTIARRWVTPGPWTMGQIVDVELTITVPNWRRHVLVYDPFPAGLESLYATRADLAQQNRQYQTPWMWQDMRRDGLLLYSYSVAPGTYTYKYQLRAFAPGKFIQRASYVEEMYTPEVFGRTVASQVEVLMDDK